jgi:hypothetical protein
LKNSKFTKIEVLKIKNHKYINILLNHKMEIDKKTEKLFISILENELKTHKYDQRREELGRKSKKMSNLNSIIKKMWLSENMIHMGVLYTWEFSQDEFYQNGCNDIFKLSMINLKQIEYHFVNNYSQCISMVMNTYMCQDRLDKTLKLQLECYPDLYYYYIKLCKKFKNKLRKTYPLLEDIIKRDKRYEIFYSHDGNRRLIDLIEKQSEQDEGFIFDITNFSDDIGEIEMRRSNGYVSDDDDKGNTCNVYFKYKDNTQLDEGLLP